MTDLDRAQVETARQHERELNGLATRGKPKKFKFEIKCDPKGLIRDYRDTYAHTPERAIIAIEKICSVDADMARQMLEGTIDFTLDGVEFKRLLPMVDLLPLRIPRN